MSHDLTPVDAFTSPVTVPDNGDQALVDVPNGAMQSLADRSLYLKNRLAVMGVAVEDNIAVEGFAVLAENGADVTGTAYVDVGADGTLNDLQEGAKIRLDGIIHAAFLADADGSHRAFLKVLIHTTVVQVLSIVPTSQTDNTDAIKQFAICTAEFEVPAGLTSAVVKIQGRVNNTSGAVTPTLKPRAPYLLRATIIRPQ
jgi:hypothetical protein